MKRIITSLYLHRKNRFKLDVYKENNQWNKSHCFLLKARSHKKAYLIMRKYMAYFWATNCIILNV